jgi:hypothetical protein
MTPSPENSSIPAPPSAEELGQGRYVITGSLGAGSQGETLDAVDKREGRPVAIKRFTLRSAKSWKDVELAEREANVLASLSHSGLPRYIEHFEENGALYLVMEKIEGETLHARRKRGARLDQAQVMRFLRDAGACLRYLHSQAPPVVHRDIKPGNVILRPDGSYCLVDFGSVRDRLKPEGGSTVVGTFGFMAPEQFQGRAGPASDVYAVGATALSLLTGREPEDLPHKGLGVDVESALRGQVDRRLISVLLRMLEPDPDKRARSVEDALRAAGLAPAVGSPSTPPPRAGSAAPPPPRPGGAAEAKAARRERLRERFHELEDEQQQRYAAREERRARKHAEREERRARKHAERTTRHYARNWHRPGPPVPPGVVLGIVLLFALRLASVATFALFGVLLPLLFTLISVPRRRERMLEIAQAGQKGLARARAHIRYQFMGGPIPPELERFLHDRGIDPETRRPSAPSPGPFGPPRGPFASSGPAPAPRQRVSVDVEAEVDDPATHDDPLAPEANETEDSPRPSRARR